MKISRKQLISLLQQRKSASIVTFTAITKPDLLKTDNPYWDSVNKIWLINKVSRVNGIINWSYERAVNKQLENEAKGTVPLEYFKAEPRKWGERIEGTPFVSHKNNLYLEVKVQKVIDSVYLDNKGKTVDKNSILPFQPKKNDSKQEKLLENPIVLRDYNLQNIVEINYGGKVYNIL